MGEGAEIGYVGWCLAGNCSSKKLIPAQENIRNTNKLFRRNDYRIVATMTLMNLLTLESMIGQNEWQYQQEMTVIAFPGVAG